MQSLWLQSVCCFAYSFWVLKPTNKRVTPWMSKSMNESFTTTHSWLYAIFYIRGASLWWWLGWGSVVRVTLGHWQELGAELNVAALQLQRLAASPPPPPGTATDGSLLWPSFSSAARGEGEGDNYWSHSMLGLCLSAFWNPTPKIFWGPKRAGPSGTSTLVLYIGCNGLFIGWKWCSVFLF